MLNYGVCGVCGSKKKQFAKRSKGTGLVNNLINNLPFEMHMYRHNFLGPGTKLNKRLNADLTPKSWSLPVDRDDEIAYRHDLCYAKHNDVETRSEVCDKQMLRDLDDILNPTTGEKLHRTIAKAGIRTKARLGMGMKKKIFPPPFVGRML